MNSETDNHETQAVLNSFYQYVGEKNAEGITALCAEHIDWYIPTSGLLPWTGKLNTKVEIEKALTLLFDAHIDTEDRFEPGHFFIDGHEAAVFGISSRIPHATGKRYTTPFCQRFTIKDGKIVKFLMLEDTNEVEKAFK